jgi:hypothetical protein
MNVVANQQSIPRSPVAARMQFELTESCTPPAKRVPEAKRGLLPLAPIGVDPAETWATFRGQRKRRPEKQLPGNDTPCGLPLFATKYATSASTTASRIQPLVPPEWA